MGIDIRTLTIAAMIIVFASIFSGTANAARVCDYPQAICEDYPCCVWTGSACTAAGAGTDPRSMCSEGGYSCSGQTIVNYNVCGGNSYSCGNVVTTCSGTCNYCANGYSACQNYAVGTDCGGFCQSCNGAGSCVNTNSSNDYQNECAGGGCTTGLCDGGGGCGFVSAGQDPNNYCSGGYSCSGQTIIDNNTCAGGSYSCGATSTTCSNTCSSYCVSGQGTCQNAPADTYVSPCTGAYSCVVNNSPFRRRNVCNGVGSCTDSDSAAPDCDGTCSNTCINGVCTNAQAGYTGNDCYGEGCGGQNVYYQRCNGAGSCNNQYSIKETCGGNCDSYCNAAFNVAYCDNSFPNTDPYNLCNGGYTCTGANSLTITDNSVCGTGTSCGYDVTTCGGSDTCSDTGTSNGGGSCSATKYYCTAGQGTCSSSGSSGTDTCTDNGGSGVSVTYYSCTDANSNGISDTCSSNSSGTQYDSCSDTGDIYGGGSCSATNYYCSGTTRTSSSSSGTDTCTQTGNPSAVTYYYCSGGNTCLNSTTSRSDDCSDSGNANGGGSCSANDWSCTLGQLSDITSGGTDTCGGTPDDPTVTYYYCNGTGNACSYAGTGPIGGDTCSKNGADCSATNYYCSGSPGTLGSTATSGSDACAGSGSPNKCQKTIYSCTTNDGSRSDTCSGSTTSIASGYVCTGSGTETAVGCSNYCGSSGANTCSGQQPTETRYSCNGAGSCGTNGTSSCSVGGACSNSCANYCVSGSCTNAPADTYVSPCTGSYNCTNGVTRTRNVCNGAGSCTDSDSAASDCSGTCANYCVSGSCTSATAGTTGTSGCSTSYSCGGANSMTIYQQACNGAGSCNSQQNTITTCSNTCGSYCINTYSSCQNAPDTTTISGTCDTYSCASATQIQQTQCNGAGSCTNHNRGTCSNTCSSYCVTGASNTCQNAPADTYVSPCTGSYNCTNGVTRTRNVCNGAGSCTDSDSAASDCSGTCANYCVSGSCTSATAGTASSDCSGYSCNGGVTTVYNKRCNGAGSCSSSYSTYTTCSGNCDSACNEGSGTCYDTTDNTDPLSLCSSGYTCSDETILDSNVCGTGTACGHTITTCSNNCNSKCVSGQSACQDTTAGTDPYNICTDSGWDGCSGTCTKTKSNNGLCGSGTACATDSASVGSGYYCSSGSEVSGACDSSASCVEPTYYTGHTCNGAGSCSTLYGSTDKDTSQTACTSTATGCTPYSWNIGGETNATVCCGDDGEYARTRSCSGACTTNSSDDACCTASSKCVYNSNCYSSGTSPISVGGTGATDYCLSGTWYDCGSDSDCANGYGCSSNMCVASFTTMVGNAAAWIWNTTGPASIVRSGTPMNWMWRTIQSGSGRQIPNGTASSWSWKNE